jgi:hypothetical protein
MGKIMKKQLHLIYWLSVPILLLSFCSSEAQTIKRTSYKNGGNFDFRWGADLEKRPATKAKFLGFLRTQLSEKKLGRAEAIFSYTIEGDPLYSTFYVVPDKNGRWIIVEKWKSIYYYVSFLPERKKRKPRIWRGTTVYKSVEALEAALKRIVSY